MKFGVVHRDVYSLSMQNQINRRGKGQGAEIQGELNRREEEIMNTEVSGAEDVYCTNIIIRRYNHIYRASTIMTINIYERKCESCLASIIPRGQLRSTNSPEA